MLRTLTWVVMRHAAGEVLLMELHLRLGQRSPGRGMRASPAAPHSPWMVSVVSSGQSDKLLLVLLLVLLCLRASSG
jgi:hypothetical protein